MKTYNIKSVIFSVIVSCGLFVVTTIIPAFLLAADNPRTTLFIVYMAARNDLYPFTKRHIKQLETLGSTPQVKIFVHLDIQGKDRKNITKEFMVEKHQLILMDPEKAQDGGTEESLILCVKKAYEQFPADDVVLVLSNHGTGAIEPKVHRTISPSELFRFNSQTNTVELDSSRGFLERISAGETAFAHPKGICFDDSTGNYLTVDKLAHALKICCSTILHKKFTILACDACLMSGIDVFSPLKESVNYFVGSQEIELSSGYRYDDLLTPLLDGRISCDDTFARHFVSSYKEVYDFLTYYTHSAIDLNTIESLEKNITQVAKLLIKALEDQIGLTVKEAIRLSRHARNCIHFQEPTFIDLGNFYDNLLRNSQVCVLKDPQTTTEFRKTIALHLKEGLSLIKQSVLANEAGKDRENAQGMSIYFPEFVIHNSYQNNSFAIQTEWISFLRRYMAVS